MGALTLERIIPLSKMATATANAAGVAVAQVGPDRYGDEWAVGTVMVQNTTPQTSANSPQCILEAAGIPQGGTYTGAQDSTDLGGTRLRQGQLVKATWTGCNPGSVSTLSVYGSRTIQGG